MSGREGYMHAENPNTGIAGPPSSWNPAAGKPGGGHILHRIVLLAAFMAAMTASIPATASASELAAPTSLDLGSVDVGTTTAAKTTTLTHNCDGVVPPLCLVGMSFTPTIGITGDFAQTNDCPPILNTIFFPGSVSCTISVTFTPTAGGSRTGTLSTGVGGPTVPLSGTGIAAPVVPTTTPAPTMKKCKKAKKHSASAAKKKCKKKKK
jgi:hypothetical protein